MAKRYTQEIHQAALKQLLKERISSIHDAAHQRFGAGKIAAKLKDEGIRVSKEELFYAQAQAE